MKFEVPKKPTSRPTLSTDMVQRVFVMEEAKDVL
jgi:hypothetical protein